MNRFKTTKSAVCNSFDVFLASQGFNYLELIYLHCIAAGAVLSGGHKTWGHWVHLSYFEMTSCLSRCYRAWSVLYILLVVMNRLSKTEYVVFISLVYSLLPKDLTVQNLLTYSILGLLVLQR